MSMDGALPVGDWLVSLETFRDHLGRDGEDFYIGLSRGSMRAELYRPVGCDSQTTHTQDELYIVLRGSGTFLKAGEVRKFTAGDVIFVEAHAEHRFETFTADFETWVVFWGPEGGEKFIGRGHESRGVSANGDV